MKIAFTIIIGFNVLQITAQDKLPPYQDSIYSFSSRLKALDAKKEITITTDAITQIKPSSKVTLIDQPNTKGKTIATISAYKTINIYSYFTGGYWLASHDSIKGFIKHEAINPNETMESALYDHEFKRLSAIYKKTDVKKILNHQIWPGMSKAMARESLGEPLTILQESGYYGFRQRWTYKDRFLIFENDFLLTWTYY